MAAQTVSTTSGSSARMMVGHLHSVVGVGEAPRSSRGHHHDRWMVTGPYQEKLDRAAPSCLSARSLRHLTPTHRVRVEVCVDVWSRPTAAVDGRPSPY